MCRAQVTGHLAHMLKHYLHYALSALCLCAICKSTMQYNTLCTMHYVRHLAQMLEHCPSRYTGGEHTLLSRWPPQQDDTGLSPHICKEHIWQLAVCDELYYSFSQWRHCNIWQSGTLSTQHNKITPLLNFVVVGGHDGAHDIKSWHWELWRSHGDGGGGWSRT